MAEIIISLVLITVVLGVLFRLDQAVQQSLTHEVALSDAGAHPPATIIKPVYRADAYSAENFRSWANQDYPSPLQLIYSFQIADDPALNIARQTTGPHDYLVIVNPVIDGYSGKMSNLRHGLQAAKHDFIVFSDSDIYAQPDVCRQLVSLHREGVDLISCLMRHVQGRNIWGRIYAAFWNYEHMAFIAPAILKHGRDATGGTMAMTRATLEKMGGLDTFKDYVAEDVAMGRKAHALGLRVGLGPIVDSPVGTMSLRQLLDKFARAALFGLSMNDLGESLQYAALFSYLVVLPLAAFLGSTVLLGTGLLLALLRLAFASRFWSQTNRERRPFVEIFLSDVIFLIAYVWAMFSRRLVWGGITYRVLAGGKMMKIEEA